jgi:hypothetical protein
MTYKRVTDLAWAAKHRYVCEPGGKPQPGVTSILRQLDKPNIIKNYVKRALEGEDPYVATQEKMDRGTRVHAYAEWCATSGDPTTTPPIHPDDRGYATAMDNFWDDYRPVPVAVEPILVNRDEPDMGYGGRADLITPDTIIDYKTGGHFLVDPVLQLNAYARCMQAEYDEDGWLHGWTAMPLTQMKLLVVYLNGDGTYLPVEVPNEMTHFLTFLALREVYTGVKEIEKWARAYEREQNA